MIQLSDDAARLIRELELAVATIERALDVTEEGQPFVIDGTTLQARLERAIHVEIAPASTSDAQWQQVVDSLTAGQRAALVHLLRPT